MTIVYVNSLSTIETVRSLFYLFVELNDKFASEANLKDRVLNAKYKTGVGSGAVIILLAFLAAKYYIDAEAKKTKGVLGVINKIRMMFAPHKDNDIKQAVGYRILEVSLKVIVQQMPSL